MKPPIFDLSVKIKESCSSEDFVALCGSGVVLFWWKWDGSVWNEIIRRQSGLTSFLNIHQWLKPVAFTHTHSRSSQKGGTQMLGLVNFERRGKLSLNSIQSSFQVVAKPLSKDERGNFLQGKQNVNPNNQTKGLWPSRGELTLIANELQKRKP